MSVNYGLRYELNSRIKEAKHRTSIAEPIGRRTAIRLPSSPPAPRRFSCTIRSPSIPWIRTAGDRAFRVDYAVTQTHRPPRRRSDHHHSPESCGKTIMSPEAFPLVFQPLITALPGVPVPFQNTPVPLDSPRALHHRRQLLFPNGDSSTTFPPTRKSICSDSRTILTALTPGHEVQLFSAGGHRHAAFSQRIHRNLDGRSRSRFREREVQRRLRRHGGHPSCQRVSLPTATAALTRRSRRSRNSIPRATPPADSGRRSIMTTGSHSTYHALQTSVTQKLLRASA